MATKLIPRERKEKFRMFSIEGSFPSRIIENYGLDLVDESHKKNGKVKEINKEAELRMKLYKLVVEFFCQKETLPLRDFILTLEKFIIFRALFKANGNQKEAAQFLGMKYTTLNERIKKYKIDFRKSPYLESNFLS